MKRALSTGTTTDWVAQPSTEKVVARSTSASDTQNLALFGTVSGASDTETVALTGATEVESAKTYSALTVARLASVAVGSVTIRGQGTAATGDIRLDANPTDGDTFEVGLTGATKTYRFKSTMAAINDVQIGATAADTADNLKRAINDDGVAGTNYYTGTTAHAHLSATVASVTVSLTDRIACDRSVAWVATYTGTGPASVRTMIGGQDGTLLATIGIGEQQAAGVISLDNWDLADSNLAGLCTPTMESFYVGKEAWLVSKLSATGATQDVTFAVDVSEDGLTWNELLTDTVTVGYGDATNEAPNSKSLGHVEHVRVRVYQNANAGAVKIHAAIWHG